jgi:signal transduction histidine kinase
VTLALSALRLSRNGFAVFGAGGFLAGNERWLELASRREAWGPAAAQPGAGTTHGTLQLAAAALARELLDGGARARTALLSRASDGALMELRLERLEARRPPLVIVVAEDVTERVRSERKSAEAREAVLAEERMRLVGELASGVAHDLNNTLHALSLRIGLLAASSLDARQRENVEVLGRICADAAERVARLQEVAGRREDVPAESFDLAGVIEEAVALARSELDERARVRGVRFHVETDLARDVRAIGCAGELRHVFGVLLLNARDAMPHGGRIRISSRVVDGRVVVKVEDEGAGIPAEHLERLFDPFFTTKGPLAMGLGLAIVQGVMRRLGGQVVASSGPGGSATFTLTFPIAAPPTAGVPATADRAVSRGHRLLVVDDDVDNLEATKYVLEDLGQDVDLAASGEDALGLLADGRRYDLVLCDVGMPGMNGWQVAEEVKRIAPGTRVVLVTGWAAEIAQDDPKRRRVDGILGKPLDLVHLRRALNAWLGAGVA